MHARALHTVALVVLVLLVCSLPACALGVPSAPRDSDSAVFRLNVTHNVYHRPNGPAAYARALAKWAARATARNVSAAGVHTRDTISTIQNVPQDVDSQYFIAIKIAGQTVVLNFDTGSVDFWVATTTTPGIGDRRIYDPKKSKTATPGGGQFEVRYGDSSFASGITYIDDITIGNIFVPRVVIELVQDWSDSFQGSDSRISGIFGASYKIDSNVVPKAPTALSQVLKKLQNPVFVADLRHQADGYYTFGNVYATDVFYTPVLPEGDGGVEPGQWIIKFDGFQVGNGQYFDRGETAIVDTGTSLLLLSNPIVKTYYDSVENARFVEKVGGWIFPCNSPLPDLKISFGSQFTATVPGQFINYSPADGLDGMCFGGLQSNRDPQNADLGFAILGDVFIKCLVVVFDVGNGRVGFSTK